jgi:DNA polymerase/3'-5' exonuclease PolX
MKKQATLFSEKETPILKELNLSEAEEIASQIKAAVCVHCERLKVKPGCAGGSIIKAYLPCQNGLFQVDIYRAKPSTFGVHLLIRTGSAEHNMWLAGYALSKGMRLKYSEGLIREGRAVAGADEKGVFAALGLPYPTPSQREIVEKKPAWMA